jgi:hypothetical protein
MDHMLAHPFFGLQQNKFFADAVKNVVPILAIFDSK